MALPAASDQIEIFKWLKYGEKVLSSKGGRSITRLYFKCSHGVNTEKGRAGFLCPARKIVDVLGVLGEDSARGVALKCAGPSPSSPSSSTSASSAGEAASPGSPGHMTTTYRHSHNHQTLASSWVSPRCMAAAARGTATPAASVSASAAHPPAGTAASLAGQKRRFSSLASTCDGLAVVAATVAALPVTRSSAWTSALLTSEVGGGSPVVACTVAADLPVIPLPVQCPHAPILAMSGAFRAVSCEAVINAPNVPRPAFTMHLPVENAAFGEAIVRSKSTGASSQVLASTSLTQPAVSLKIPADSSTRSSALPAMISESSPAPAALPQAPISAAAASELWTLARSASQSSAVTHQHTPTSVAAGASSGAGAAPTASGSTAALAFTPTRAVAALHCAAPAMAPGNHEAEASSSLASKPLAPTAAPWIPYSKTRHAIGSGGIPLSNSREETAAGSPGKMICLGLTEHLKRFQSGSVEDLSISLGVNGVGRDMGSVGLNEGSTLNCVPPIDLELRLSLGQMC
ncbi:hypothetical protein CLOP_g4609 [Closterium sp. NIES-67]|nr:hypothetical protein CLOP_g4609 [Closterium sp. NIES-67]